MGSSCCWQEGAWDVDTYSQKGKERESGFNVFTTGRDGAPSCQKSVDLNVGVGSGVGVSVGVVVGGDLGVGTGVDPLLRGGSRDRSRRSSQGSFAYCQRVARPAEAPFLDSDDGAVGTDFFFITNI
eukprot:jgi/Mesen1/10161/ME000076S09670